MLPFTVKELKHIANASAFNQDVLHSAVLD